MRRRRRCRRRAAGDDATAADHTTADDAGNNHPGTDDAGAADHRYADDDVLIPPTGVEAPPGSVAALVSGWRAPSADPVVAESLILANEMGLGCHRRSASRASLRSPRPNGDFGGGRGGAGAGRPGPVPFHRR